MGDPIVYIDRSRIRPGKLEDVKLAIKNLVAFVERDEPQLVTYAFYLDEERMEQTVVAVHPDSASLEYHIEAGAALFRAFAPLIELQSIDCFGEPGEKVRAQLRQKAEMLGGDTVRIHALHAGVSRLG